MWFAFLFSGNCNNPVITLATGLIIYIYNIICLIDL